MIVSEPASRVAWKSFVSSERNLASSSWTMASYCFVLRGGALHACGPRLQVSGVLSLAVCSGRVQKAMRDLLASLLQQLFRCPRAQRVIYARCLHRRFWALALPKASNPLASEAAKPSREGVYVRFFGRF